ncbi:MAG: tetratricopeptide repeat protein [Acidobacteria bacterium]|nr:tetratricopeptide repeat protein [Acidobacteriota bacterium]
MPKRKTYSLLFPLVLAAALLFPHAALGSRFPDAPAPAASDAGAPAVRGAGEEPAAGGAKPDGGAADETQKPKRKGNAFTRALGAPFRALARLFGGGKSKSETAKKSPAPTQETTAAASTQSTQDVEAARNVAAGESKPGKGDAAPVSPGETTAAAAATSSAPVEAPRVEPIAAPARARETAEVPRDTAVATRASEGVRIVRPSVGEVARELQPRIWIPKIVGVPSDPVSQGRALLQHGYLQEAIAELQTAATTGLPEQLAEANNLLGLAYDRLGWHLQAAEAYERALSASPKDYVALTNLGYSLYLADDYRGALKRLKQAARLAPNEPVILNNLGVVNARLGRYGDAYRNFARVSNEYEAHLKLAGILEDQRRDREAVKHYEAALRLQPGASAVLERLVALYERTGARDKADTARRALGQPKNPQKTATGGGG